MATDKAFLIFPHQLFHALPRLAGNRRIYLIEEPLFFTQHAFHRQKLVLHRASMKAFYEHCSERDLAVTYIDFSDAQPQSLARRLKIDGMRHITIFNVVDDWLQQRIEKLVQKIDADLEILESPGFYCSQNEIREYFAGKKHFVLNSFYKQQRQQRNILMRGEKPAGGQWNFDADNRKKLPKDLELPKVYSPQADEHIEKAQQYIAKHFNRNPGEIDAFHYPVTREKALRQLQDFLENRLRRFGVYQDAIAKDAGILFHSLLTPSLNCGLLTPDEVVERTVNFATEHKIPINSTEGFVRQILGWREFIRGIYCEHGRRQRTANFFNHRRKLPRSFWTAKTGMDPVDTVIRRVLKTGYAHHIERLMILGNFMLLCEIDPDEVYSWFMELFIDAYDWVMVPNVYGMSQFADGGLMATKPYFSSSNYLLKMSDFKKGEWCEVWDGLFWRFIEKHKSFFAKQHRLSMMVRQLDKMKPDRRRALIGAADTFLKQL